jgi:HEAT repeat protein
MMRLTGRVSLAASLALGLGVGLVSVPPAPAEDSAKVKQLYDEGMSALEKRDFETALAKFKALFQEDPNQSEILDLIKSTETKNFLLLLEKGGDYARAAERFLSMSHVAAKERSQDAARIQPLVETAIKDSDLEKRRAASRQIMAEHGAYAVPFLVRYLGSNDTDERVRAIFVIEDIGVEAVLPLVEVLNSPDAQVRQTAIVALRKLVDPRAYPVLEWIAKSKDQPDSVRRAAENALKSLSDSMGGTGPSSMNPEQAFLKLADLYYTKAPDVLRELGSVNTMWKWEEGQLKWKDCPAFMYHLRLAEKACQMAIASSPESKPARSMLAIVYAAQQVSLAGASPEFLASDAGKEEAGRLAMVDAAMRASGADVLLGGLGLALKYNDAPVAIAILRSLPTYGSVPLDEKSPVVAALASPDQRVQWNAALTVIRMSPKAAFPRFDLVVPLVSNAVGLTSVRQVLVVCEDTRSAVQMQTELNAAGMHAVVSRTGADGLYRSKQAPVDCVVVVDGLKDLMAQQVVNEVRRDYRTKQVPILVGCAEAQAEATKNLFKDEIQGVVTLPLSANVYVPLVKEAASHSPLDDRARALALSEEACGVLADASPSAVLDFTKAAPALVGTLNGDKPESLKMKALAALKKWGGDASVAGLLDAVANTANPEGVRAEAGRVAGVLLSGKVPSQKSFEILMHGLADGSIAVRTACAGALGSAKLSDAQRQMVLDKAKL